MPTLNHTRSLNRMRPLNQKSTQGFTLLEVLIAGLILFITLTASLGAYQTAMSGSHKAAQHLHMLQVTELAQAHIQKAIRDRVISTPEGNTAPSEIAGRTNVLNVEVEWHALLVEQGAPPPRFDDSNDGEAEYLPRFFKYETTMNLRAGTRQHSFSYIELAWFNQLSVKGS